MREIRSKGFIVSGRVDFVCVKCNVGTVIAEVKEKTLINVDGKRTTDFT